MSSGFQIICGERRFDVSYHILGQYCERFADIRRIDEQFPGYQYALFNTVDPSVFEVFLDYIRMLSENRGRQVSLITRENIASLFLLADELGCERLTRDCEAFQQTHRVNIRQQI